MAFSIFKKKNTGLNYSVGQLIPLGTYAQTASGEKCPVMWKILSVRKEKALLISEDCLIQSGYCDMSLVMKDRKYLEWANCLSREVLNEQFYFDAFSKTEQNMLCAKRIDKNTVRQECSDKVFLLTEEEVRLFMPKAENRIAKGSEYVLNHLLNGTARKGNQLAWWILPEDDQVQSIYPKAVFQEGEIHFHGRNIYHKDFALRPCVLIDLSCYEEYCAEKPTDVTWKTMPPSTEDSLRIDSEMDAQIRAYCQKYLMLLELLYEDFELNQWCREYSAYQEILSHKYMHDIIYEKFMKEAYNLPQMPEFMALDMNHSKHLAPAEGSREAIFASICKEIRMDYGSNGYLIHRALAEGTILRLMKAYLSIPVSSKECVKNMEYRKYRIHDIPWLEKSQSGTSIGSHRVFHDVSMKKWRVTYQLDKERLWFLSVFLSEDGTFDLKFSLDKEAASDSHYEFTNEAELRKALKQPGDEELYLHEILIRYANKHGAASLLSVIYPYVTAQFHYD